MKGIIFKLREIIHPFILSILENEYENYIKKNTKIHYRNKKGERPIIQLVCHFQQL
jgi:hypothetical protein